MSEQEENARQAAYLEWSERETSSGTREGDVGWTPVSKARAAAKGAFLTGWRNAMEYAARQGGPG